MPEPVQSRLHLTVCYKEAFAHNWLCAKKSAIALVLCNKHFLFSIRNVCIMRYLSSSRQSVNRNGGN